VCVCVCVYVHVFIVEWALLLLDTGPGRFRLFASMVVSALFIL
jgi:hypothetical protein